MLLMLRRIVAADRPLTPIIGRRALVTARVMLPRVFPEGTSGEGRTQLAGRVLDRDAALPRARHMFPQDLAARVTAASGMSGGAER